MEQDTEGASRATSRPLYAAGLQPLRDRIADVEQDVDQLWRSLEKAGETSLLAFHNFAHRAEPAEAERREASYLFKKVLSAISLLNYRAEELNAEVLKMANAVAAHDGGEGWLSRRDKEKDRNRRR
jgi:ParB-like chromosome segregation protein Spo0J